MPVQVQLIGIHEQAAQGHFLLGKDENGVLADVALANLRGGFLQRVAHLHEVFGDGAEVFAVQLGVVGVVHYVVTSWGLGRGTSRSARRRPSRMAGRSTSTLKTVASSRVPTRMVSMRTTKYFGSWLRSGPRRLSQNSMASPTINQCTRYTL